MEEFRHFSHDHPLTLFLNKEVDVVLDIHEAYMCSICGLPILSSPSYTCSITGCKFFLHEPCAKLPEALNTPRHHDTYQYSHLLYLEQKTPPADSDCQSKLYQNFAYQCWKCNTDVHPFLVVPVEIKSNHESHPSHPLVANRRETLSLCDACGEEHRGFFFTCQKCDFWIHQDCTILPSTLKLASHPHPFVLTYSLTSNIDELFYPDCAICKKSVRLFNIGLYVCCQCTSYAHVNCAKSNMENLKSETILDIIKLPADEDDTFPSLMIRRHLDSNPVPGDKKSTIEKLHKHPLKFHEHGCSSSSGEACNLVCDVCVQPVDPSSPFYSCLEYCNFLAHNTCANLLPSFDFSFVALKISLFPELSGYFFGSVYPCFICCRPWNGFCYYYDDIYCRYFLDLDCITALNTIKHASHSQHVLFRTREARINAQLRCCSDGTNMYDVYRCIICDDFYIHVKCALLPKMTHHKFDEHPLELITSSSNNHEDEYNYCLCEFCEKVIVHKFWYYGCRKCEQYFHINCIPSVGHLSRVKFGKALVDNNVHSHPLTLTRMLTHGRNEMCGYCNETIHGFVEEMAFRCSDCGFWIHFSCARDSSCANDKKSKRSLPLYSESPYFVSY